MKIKVEMINKTKEEHVLIQCYEVTEKIDEIIEFVKSRDTTLAAFHDSQIHSIFLQDICYIEAVDNKCICIFSESGL